MWTCVWTVCLLTAFSLFWWTRMKTSHHVWSWRKSFMISEWSFFSSLVKIFSWLLSDIIIQTVNFRTSGEMWFKLLHESPWVGVYSCLGPHCDIKTRPHTHVWIKHKPVIHFVVYIDCRRLRELHILNFLKWLALLFQMISNFFIFIHHIELFLLHTAQCILGLPWNQTWDAGLELVRCFQISHLNAA